MFTGIIEERGVVTSAEDGHLVIEAAPAFIARIPRGGSVAVDGACLTVVSHDTASFRADVMPETYARTTLGSLIPGSSVNLELPATPTSFLAGHVVQGHVDAAGTVEHVATEGNSRLLTVRVPASLSAYIVEKGSVAVSGVSLTVIGAGSDSFTVGIIPHTAAETTLGRLREGDAVNVETDILAKYAQRQIMRDTYDAARQ